MRELTRLLAALENGEVEKIVLHPMQRDARRPDDRRALQRPRMPNRRLIAGLLAPAVLSQSS
jgi:hypothetical protein